MIRGSIAVAVLLASAGCAHQVFRSEAELAQRTTPPPALALSATISNPSDLRSAPHASAPVLSRLDAGTQVTASDQSVRGFRRVKAPDGRSGYVEERGLALGSPVSTAPAPTSSATPPAAIPAPAATAEPTAAPASAPAPAEPASASPTGAAGTSAR
jgi:hypothetical protein